MNSADPNRQSLVYADGYSYTEIFQLPDLPGMASGNRLVRVFHTFLSDDRGDILGVDPTPESPSDVAGAPGKLI